MKQDVIDKLNILVTSAFGLVAALAWNDAIQGLFKEGGPLEFLAASGKWGYAIIITILAVVLTIWIGRLSERAKGKKKEEKKK